MMKYALLALSLLLLLASAFGLVKVLNTPVERTADEKYTQLSYEQSGRFGYTAYASPSTYYGGQAPASEASPLIPTKFIESLEVSYHFQAGDAAVREVAVMAVLENPGAWQKRLTLAPAQSYAGDFALVLPLDLAQYAGMAATINGELGLLMSPAFNLTLEVQVRGGDGAGGLSRDFTQPLLLKLSPTTLKMSNELVLAQGRMTGRFDYKVKLVPNALYGAVTLTPPAALTTVSLQALGPDDVVFTRLLTRLEANFSYRLTAPEDLPPPSLQASVTAQLENPGLWSKTFTLVPATSASGTLNLSFLVDTPQLLALFDAIQQDAGAGGGNCLLTLTASVQATAQTGYGTIRENYTQSIRADLRKAVLAWDGSLSQTVPGKIEGTRVSITPQSFLGLPVAAARIGFGALTALLLVVFVWALLCSPLLSLRGEGQLEERVQEIRSRYQEMIIEAAELPEARANEKVLAVRSLDDLVKTSQGLLKPIMHRVDKGEHVFCVFDDSTRYQYKLA